jgi:hypothetical protein
MGIIDEIKITLSDDIQTEIGNMTGVSSMTAILIYRLTRHSHSIVKMDRISSETIEAI